MIKGEIKKEIYFTNDVFREAAQRISIPEFIVREVFSNFIKDFKQHILETDHLYYGLLPLGVLSINRDDLDKSLKKFSNKYYKEQDEKAKEELKLYLENFKVRDKRMRVEKEKFRVIYPDLFYPSHFKMEKNSMFRPSKFESDYYNNKVKLKEAAQAQNKYAYNWYQNKNKPINH